MNADISLIHLLSLIKSVEFFYFIFLLYVLFFSVLINELILVIYLIIISGHTFFIENSIQFSHVKSLILPYMKFPVSNLQNLIAD